MAKIKNDTNTINVDGHITKIITYDDIRLGKKTFPNVRVILLPISFAIQEIAKMKEEKDSISLAIITAWSLIFAPIIKPRKIVKISRLFYKKSRYLKNDSFYESLCNIEFKQKMPIGRMMEFGEITREKSTTNFMELFRETQNMKKEKIKMPAEKLNQTLRDFMDCYLIYIDIKKMKGGSKEEKAKIVKEKFLKVLKEKIPDYEERKQALRNMARRIENKCFSIYEKIANNFSEKLKKYVPEDELKLFNLLYTRQDFIGGRIIKWDIDTELINPKDLLLIPVLVLAKIYKVKTAGGYSFERALKLMIKSYLKMVEDARNSLGMDEKDEKREERLREDEIPVSDYILDLKDYYSLLEKAQNPINNPEEEYIKKEKEKNIKKFIKQYLSQKEKQIYEMYCLKEMSQEEIAEKIGCSQPYVSKVLKTIGLKLKKSGFKLDDLI